MLKRKTTSDDQLWCSVRKNCEYSGDDLVDYFARHVCQSEATTVVLVSQFFMIQAEQVQDGGVQIVEVNFVFSRLESDFVLRAVVDAAFNTAAGHPRAEAVRVMVSSRLLPGLSNRQATKLAAPDNERVF